MIFFLIYGIWRIFCCNQDTPSGSSIGKNTVTPLRQKKKLWIPQYHIFAHQLCASQARSRTHCSYFTRLSKGPFASLKIHDSKSREICVSHSVQDPTLERQKSLGIRARWPQGCTSSSIFWVVSFCSSAFFPFPPGLSCQSVNEAPIVKEWKDIRGIRSWPKRSLSIQAPGGFTQNTKLRLWITTNRSH